MLLNGLTIGGVSISRGWLLWILISGLLAATPLGCCLTSQVWQDVREMPHVRELLDARIEASGALVLTVRASDDTTRELTLEPDALRDLEPPRARRIPRVRRALPDVSAGPYDLVDMGDHVFLVTDDSVGKLPLAPDGLPRDAGKLRRAWALTPLSVAADVALAPVVVPVTLADGVYTFFTSLMCCSSPSLRHGVMLPWCHHD